MCHGGVAVRGIPGDFNFKPPCLVKNKQAPRYTTLCHDILCHAILCYAMLCYTILPGEEQAGAPGAKRFAPLRALVCVCVCDPRTNCSTFVVYNAMPYTGICMYVCVCIYIYMYRYILNSLNNMLLPDYITCTILSYYSPCCSPCTRAYLTRIYYPLYSMYVRSDQDCGVIFAIIILVLIVILLI